MICVGRDLKDHLIPTTPPWAGTPSTSPGCSELIQPGLEHCQGGDSHSFSGQPAPGPYHLMVKNFFLISNLNLPSFSLKPLPLVLSLVDRTSSPVPCRKSQSSSLVGPFRYWKAAIRSLWSLLFSRLNNPNSLSFLWPRSNRSMSVLGWGLQSWMQDSRWDLTLHLWMASLPSSMSTTP